MKKLDPLSVFDPNDEADRYQELQTLLAALGTAVDRAATAMVADEREALAEGLRDGQIRPVGLALALAKDSYAWSLPQNAGASLPPQAAPAYYEWKAAVARLRQAGSQLQDYAGILGRLASAKALNPAETAALEKKLDALLQSGLTTGRLLDSQTSRKATAGLLSMAAADLFRLVLKRRRGASLRQAIAANDETFSSYVQSLRTLLRMLHVSLRLHYVDAAGDLLATWTPANAPAGKGGSALSAKRLLALNDSTLDRLDALATIETILDGLPTAHAGCIGEGV
jgi:hypothetical protein